MAKIDNMFVLIEASKLSLEDDFMQYEPEQPLGELRLKALLETVIKHGVKDFWRPRIDPSFNDNKDGIVYASGMKPAVGQTYNWWKEAAKEYIPKCGSRLGTKSEYVAFLGVLIKTLVSEGWSVEDAWNAVCNDSKKVGHYRDSENAKHDFELTGSREICGFYDLANTYKVLSHDREDNNIEFFWYASGSYEINGSNYALADFEPCSLLDEDWGNNSVGWLVLEEGSAEH